MKLMEKRKRIALFVGQADESYQSRFITGFLNNAFASGYDVCVFSMYRKYQDTLEREQGDSNIFSLMNPDQFNGAVILKDSIQTENAAEKLELHLKEIFKKPIVIIEKESDLFPSICTDCYSAIFELINHLIKVHGCKDIAFLSGKKWHKHSKERLQGYRDAMAKAGLPVSEDRIFYGDFWYQSGEVFAEELMKYKDNLPDAVACANDQMAIGLCKALNEQGIRVPEDIAVVGFDSTFEGQTSPKPITSGLIPAEEFGEYAFHFLIDRINGKMPESFKLKPQLLIGESCGCHCESMPKYEIKRDTWGTDISEENYDSVFNTMDECLITQSSLQEYLDTVYSYAYQLRGAEEFHLCLPYEWKKMSPNVHIKNNGYSQQMIHAIRYCTDRKNNLSGINECFDTSEMLPELYEKHDSPMAYFFTPLFFEKECFGYACISYGSALRSYDRTYARWINSVCRGFEILRRNLALEHMHEQLERLHTNKFAFANHAFESLDSDEKQQYRLVSKILDENLLEYHFQPIVSAVDGSVYAYEALMRAKTNSKISPLSIIKYASMQERLSDIERSTFLNVLHYIDENEKSFGDARVFINSIPGVSVGESAIEEVDSFLAAHSDRVVVELTEEAELKDSELEVLKEYFGKMHINIAVDDYGSGYSNVSNLLRYMPDYVKIDRSLLSEIHEYPQKQHFVREIIDFCHDNGIKALAEGVETTEELQTVIHLGVDLIQGFYTARPSAEIITQIDEKCRSEIKHFYQERTDGNTKRVYMAGKTNRVSLAKLVKDECTDIIIGHDEMLYKDISIIGTPQMKTELHLIIAPNYIGRITLEDVYFSNVKNRPCIELGENSSVTLVLVGSNTLAGSGIQIPESAKLTIEGNGSLSITVNAAETYAIGNDLKSRHGEITFNQDGAIIINSRGKDNVCIGSGLGGSIRIQRGEYILHIDTELSVGIGAIDGPADLDMTMCHIESDYLASYGLLIGSLNKDANICITKSSIKFDGHAKSLSAIGTINGSKASIRTNQVSLTFSIMADQSTCFGSLHGSTNIDFSDSHIKIDTFGQGALALGGYNENTNLSIIDSDIKFDLKTSEENYTRAPENNIHVQNGRYRITINDSEIEHDMKIEYS